MLASALTLLLAQGSIQPELVRDLDAGLPVLVSPSSSDPRPLAEFGSGLLLVADERPEFPALFFLDTGTDEVVQVSPATWGEPDKVAVLAPDRALVAVDQGSSSNRYLLTTDGSLAGTEFLSPDSDLRLVGGPVVYAGQAWFLIRSVQAGTFYDLYSSDGTLGGTALVHRFDIEQNTFEEAQLWVAGQQLFLTVPRTGQSLFLNQPELWALPSAGAAPVFLLGAGDSGTSQVNNATVYEDNLWFVTNNPNKPVELWVSDGTPGGTQLVPGLSLGNGSTGQVNFLAQDNAYLWLATDEMNQQLELARVPSGTQQLVVVPGALPPLAGLSPSSLAGAILADGRLVYSGFGVVQPPTFGIAIEPWVSDGTAAGSFELADLSLALGGSAPADFVPFGAEVLFTASGPNGREVYTTAGTPTSTRLVADLFVGPGDSNPSALFASDAVYFSAETLELGRELFSSQGLSTGAPLVANIAGDASSASSAPERLLRFGDQVFFAAEVGSLGLEPFVSDGTEVGTFSLGDLFPGEEGSDPLPLVTLGQKLIFTATTPENGIEPWVTDGTPAGTQLLSDLIPGPDGSFSSGFVRVGQLVYFAARFGDPGTSKLFSTDGTPAGTQAVLDVVPGFQFFGQELKRAAVLGRRIVFDGPPVSGFGPDLLLVYHTDLNQLIAISQTAAGEVFERPFNFTRVGDLVYFVAAPPGALQTLYVTDGSQAGTQRVIPGDFPRLSNTVGGTQLTELGGDLLFVGFDNTFGREVWRTDGTQAGTSLLVDTTPGFDFTGPFGLTRVKDRVLFTSVEFLSSGQTQQLWITDGTPSGTAQVPGAGGTDYRSLVAPAQRLGSTDQALLSASFDKTGFEFLRSSPIGQALEVMPENNVGPPSSLTSSVTQGQFGFSAGVELGGLLLFPSNDPVVGSELHSLDLASLGFGGGETFGEGCSANGDEPRIDWSGSVSPGQSFDLEIDRAEPGATAFALFSAGDLPQQLLLDGCPIYLGAPKILAFAPVDAAGQASLPVLVPSQPQLLGQRLILQWASTAANGPLLGSFETSNALELLLATAP